VQPCAAAVCAATKTWAPGGSYDHVGVVVEGDSGDLLIAEEGFDGVRFRPFDERIVCSRSFEIIVRPLRTKLNASQVVALRESAQAAAAAGGGYGRAIAARLASDGPIGALERAPLDFVVRLYSAAGLPTASLRHLRDLAPGTTSPILSASDLWFRDKRS
jgi:hypothetical protein